MSNVRYFSASVGHTQTAGAVFGGPSPSGTNVELYDGTNWTAGGNTPSSQKNGQAASGS